MITLIGLCLLFMTLLHWIVKPLEMLLTPFLELQHIGVAGLLLLAWIFATSTGERSGV
ncbi:hypothetical protein [Synechococcus sp. CC9616]|uniref:hypothetical protein n=1 Tax=Synechococcus sp. CC9616 TaxID=110663 RepID=UPI001E4A522B|nr:hypothetical protein [Synechococcus sp. CC9616]